MFTRGVTAGIKPTRLLEVIQGGAYGQGAMPKRRMPNLSFKASFEQVGLCLALEGKDVGSANDLVRER